jgi:hypothetical protein
MPEGRRTHRRVSQIGPCSTRFGGVTEILNQQPGAFLTIEHAIVSEHAEPSAIAALSAMVVVGSILVIGTPA